VAKSQSKNDGASIPEDVLIQEGERILEDPSNLIRSITISNSGFENNSRPVCISKVNEAYHIYKDLVVCYGMIHLIEFINSHSINSFDELIRALPEKTVRLQWANIGGQLLPEDSLNTVLQDIRKNSIQSWDELHQFYEESGKAYGKLKFRHAFASLLELLRIEKLDASRFKELLSQTLNIKEWMVKTIYDSRAKDYQSEFRKMVYGSDEEMEVVTGKFEDNVFINQQKEELKQFKSSVEKIIRLFKL
jgi:hypothetical protein